MDTEWLNAEGDEDTDRPDGAGGPDAERDDEDLPAPEPEPTWDEDDGGPSRGGGSRPAADLPATLHGDDDGKQPH